MPADGTIAAVNSQDFGTSRWQLVIERYTNFPCIRKGRRRPQLAREGSHPGRRRGPLSGVDLPPERWPYPPLVTQLGSGANTPTSRKPRYQATLRQ
jgi:hypothetical protein